MELERHSTRMGNGDSIHSDQHALAFDPQDPKVIYAGNDGGIFRSPDAGTTWQSLNSGLAISEVEYLAQRPDEADWILAGLQDNGTIRRHGEQGWTQVALGDGRTSPPTWPIQTSATTPTMGCTWSAPRVAASGARGSS